MEGAGLLEAPLEDLCAEARRLRDAGHGRLVTYSPKVFIPLTKLCRDVCHYCTFAAPPRRGERAFMTVDEVLEVARAGADAGCTEALFTLGDKPERRYRVAREELAALGCETTIQYLARMCRLVLEERIEALLAIRGLHERYGHVQEVIVQNFRAKPGTRMADHPEPDLEELLWTCAAARIVLGPQMNIQAPPNLSYSEFPRLLDAG